LDATIISVFAYTVTIAMENIVYGVKKTRLTWGFEQFLWQIQ